MAELSKALERIHFGNSLRDYALALLIALLFWILSRITRAHVGKLVSRLTSLTASELDDRLAGAAIGPASGLVLLAGLHFATLGLQMSGGLRVGIQNSLLVAFATLVTILCVRGVDIFFRHVVQPWTLGTPSRLDDQLAVFGRKISKILVVLVIVAIVMDKVGLDVISLVTGLGVGGLAVALAAQETLGNVLGSLQIMTDQPFTVGDWIRVEGYFGQVTDIGLRSTKIETRGRIQVVIPNRVIAQAAIENVSLGGDLAVNLAIGLTYATSDEGVRQAVAIIREILDGQEGVRDGHLIHFLGFGDSSLTITCTYYVDEIDAYWDVQHGVNMAIKRRFDEASLDFAFPTRTVHLVGDKA
jgi:MscS family membrane protein